MKRILILIFSVFLSYSQQVQLSGNVQYTESFGDEVDHNDNTQGDNPFNRLRAKVFIFSPISEKIDLDIEVAFDDQAEPDRWIWLHGANVTFRDVMEDGGLNVRAGKIQMNIGQFVNRINEAENPLIGLPLAYHYRTNVDWRQVWDGNSQVLLRDKRNSDGYLPDDAYPTASPVAYEAVWSNGIELFGHFGDFQYSVAVTDGSLSNPRKNVTEDKQFSGRLGYQFTDWLGIGISAARNRYLSRSINLTANQSIKDFYQVILAGDLSIVTPEFKFFAEYFNSDWDNNNREGKLTVQTGFAEMAWLLPFSTEWEVVARFDMMNFNDILYEYYDTNTNSSKTEKRWWDSNLTRIEAGLRYQMNRSIHIKAVYQQWDYKFYSTVGTSSFQLIAFF